FRNSLTVGSLKKINNLFIKDIFHGYCLKRQSLNLCGSNSPPLAAIKKTPIRLIPRPLGRGGFIYDLTGCLGTHFRNSLKIGRLDKINPLF
ncbi:MAG: hypothetical protein, partial [Olavius algarvensis Gamma 1 endosymbiont]